MRVLLVSSLLLCSAATAAMPHRERWLAVADTLMTTPVEKYPFNWGEGVQMIGMMKIYERTRNRGYADYVEKWTAQYVGRSREELLALSESAKPGRRIGYCGHWSPGTAILYLYQARKNAEHLKLAEMVNAFIRDGAERGLQGGLGHWIGSNQLWVDTLYMACPLLAGLGKMQRKSDYINDAANQILIYAKPLQEPKSGLFFHMWDWTTGKNSPDLWGRGNGWVLMSLADTMEVMNRKHRLWKPLQEVAEKLARGIQATQDGDGMWHTVMDDPSSHAEASASMMFCYGLLKLVRLKALPAGYVAVARKGWDAVSTRYIKDGVVTGVSAGTTPLGGEHYRARPLGVQTWGTGAYLMAGSEMDRLR